MNIQKTAEKIVKVCDQAYSYDRWSKEGFLSVAKIFLKRGFSPKQVIGILYSKEMRWAADSTATEEQEYNHIPGDNFIEYEKNRGGRGVHRPLTKTQADKLTWAAMPSID